VRERGWVWVVGVDGGVGVGGVGVGSDVGVRACVRECKHPKSLQGFRPWRPRAAPLPVQPTAVTL
jgi:hypothetical protein